jgi:hypothetical protein
MKPKVISRLAPETVPLSIFITRRVNERSTADATERLPPANFAEQRMSAGTSNPTGRRFPHPVFMLAGLLWLTLLPATEVRGQNTCRPCGPAYLRGPLSLLIPQGAAGADFRPACRRHDACYEIPGVDKRACDREFLRGMHAACENSRHPLWCRFVANQMHRVTANRGWEAFLLSQPPTIAARLRAGSQLVAGRLVRGPVTRGLLARGQSAGVRGSR